MQARRTADMSGDIRSDSELVVLARSGDRDAFGCLVERYQVIAKSVVLRMVSNQDAARELIQEAILQTLLSLDRLRDSQRFKSWFYSIVINVCRSYYREQKMAPLSLDDLSRETGLKAINADASLADPSMVVEKQELHRLVAATVKDLSPNSRQAVLLFYYRQMSLQEIAAALGISEGAVKVRLYRARKQLRAQLLSTYPEIDLYLSIEQRRQTMISVRIADIIVQDDKHVVLLSDDAGGRLLPIWIGEHEAMSIVIGLQKTDIVRPLTHDLMADILTYLGVELEEARVEALKEDLFYGVAKLRQGDQHQEMDARPSDILALAARTGSPIYVGEEVMESVGIDITDKGAAADQLGKGIEAHAKALEQLFQKTGKKVDPEARDKCIQELVEYLFSGSE
jgi:RNA polymerase sigma factor (sigma-70 family)